MCPRTQHESCDTLYWNVSSYLVRHVKLLVCLWTRCYWEYRDVEFRVMNFPSFCMDNGARRKAYEFGSQLFCRCLTLRALSSSSRYWHSSVEPSCWTQATRRDLPIAEHYVNHRHVSGSLIYLFISSFSPSIVCFGVPAAVQKCHTSWLMVFLSDLQNAWPCAVRGAILFRFSDQNCACLSPIRATCSACLPNGIRWRVQTSTRLTDLAVTYSAFRD
jgi:hypothetical protein